MVLAPMARMRSLRSVPTSIPQPTMKRLHTGLSPQAQGLWGEPPSGGGTEVNSEAVEVLRASIGFLPPKAETDPSRLPKGRGRIVGAPPVMGGSWGGGRIVGRGSAMGD